MFCYNYFIIIIIIIDKKFLLSIWVWVSMNFIVMSMTDVIMKKRNIIVILMRKLCLCAFSTVCPDTEDTNWKLDPMGYIWLLSTISGCFQTESWPSTLTARLPAVTLMDANEYEISQILPIFKWKDPDSNILRSERFWSFCFCWQQWRHCYFVNTEHSFCCFTFCCRPCSFGGCKLELESRILENIFQRRIKSPSA